METLEMKEHPWAKLHHEAMGEIDKGNWSRALQLEKRAAALVPLDVQPTRAILYRSAASIANNMEQWGEAIDLAQRGLFKASDFFAAELREVLDAAINGRVAVIRARLDEFESDLAKDRSTGVFHVGYYVKHEDVRWLLELVKMNSPR